MRPQKPRWLIRLHRLSGPSRLPVINKVPDAEAVVTIVPRFLVRVASIVGRRDSFDGFDSVGRDARAQIGIFGDPAVVRRHAQIEATPSSSRDGCRAGW